MNEINGMFVCPKLDSSVWPKYVFRKEDISGAKYLNDIRKLDELEYYGFSQQHIWWPIDDSYRNKTLPNELVLLWKKIRSNRSLQKVDGVYCGVDICWNICRDISHAIKMLNYCNRKINSHDILVFSNSDFNVTCPPLTIQQNVEWLGYDVCGAFTESVILTLIDVYNGFYGHVDPLIKQHKLDILQWKDKLNRFCLFNTTEAAIGFIKWFDRIYLDSEALHFIIPADFEDYLTIRVGRIVNLE